MTSSVINFAKQLISIPSVSPMDLGCQELISNRLIGLGFSVEQININNTSNIWACKGSGNTLMFAGHTDVVSAGNLDHWKFPPFSPTIYRGNFFGRGIVDMKGALSAMIIAVERYIKKYPNFKGRLAFLITSDEESQALDGTKKVILNLIHRKESIDYCIIGEPSSVKRLGDVIKYGRRGSITACIRIYSIQKHIAYSKLFDNPIHQTIFFLKELLSTCWGRQNKFFASTSVQIYEIKSQSISSNMIPCKLTVKFNFRFNNEITSSEIKEKVQELLSNSNIEYSINWNLSGDPFLTKIGLLSDVVIQSIKSVCNIVPKLSTSGGTSDGRFISKICSEIIELGLVNKTIHKVNEKTKVEDLEVLSLMYENIITRLFFKIESESDKNV
ncbi:MAG: succinyl-diaminopimelate desuccinylase [Buchnera aphidicola (Chaetogeoica yunlongensis)]